jgi:hypothetical protein
LIVPNPGMARAFLLTLVAALVTTAPAAAAPRSAGPRPAPPARPKPATRPAKAAEPAIRFEKLTLLPPRIRLGGPNAGHRVVVLGTTANGKTVDLTGKVRLVTGSLKVAAADGNRVAARGDGKTALVATYGELTARSAVEVADAGAAPYQSFRNDVVPVLARLGCSAGTCHGANSGKGGFKLSLRGYAPELDFLWITRQFSGRRISPEEPEQSLFLRKPLMEVPHGGGQALTPGSPEHRTLLGWLREGAPGLAEAEPRLTALRALPGDRTYQPRETQRLIVQAEYSDGSTRDVTDRVLFRSNDSAVAEVSGDGVITAVGPGATAVQAKFGDLLAVVRATVPFPFKVDPAAYRRPGGVVDTPVLAKLRQLNLEPGGPCSDEEFLRRVFIDVLGTLPTSDEARRFLDDPAPDKRERLIEAVLQRPEYASIWALKLCDVSMVRKEHMGRKNTVALHQWLTEQFLANRPWDQLTADLLTATGAPEENPATLWWASRQSTRPNARGWVRHYELTGEVAAQVFLGQRIQCAKCHNHPTERYTQDDYYRFAAIFAQVNGEGRADPIPDRFVATDPGEVRQPRTGQVPAAPVGAAPLTVAEGEDRRVRFVEWLRGEGKDLFARAAVNRVWARLFGQGIVEPVDDLRSTNPARNEALLDALAREFIAHGYDLKHLIGVILRSRTYQTTSQATRHNLVDTQFFSRYPVRRLQGEELVDALAQVTGVPDRFATFPVGTRAIELPDSELPSQALDTFGRPTRVTPCDCDRNPAPSLSQALELFNGDALQAKLRHPEGIVLNLIRAARPESEAIEELYLRALSRRPTPRESEAVQQALLRSPNLQEGMQDLLWALLNTKEFMFQH